MLGISGYRIRRRQAVTVVGKLHGEGGDELLICGNSWIHQRRPCDYVKCKEISANDRFQLFTRWMLKLDVVAGVLQEATLSLGWLHRSPVDICFKRTSMAVISG